jgi:hypothetical protein
MKIISYSLIFILIVALCPSCNREVKDLQEEIKHLRNDNNFLKADNIALKKELEELYKKIDEKDFMKQKPVAKDKEESINKESTLKRPDRVEPERIKKPENGKTTR